MAQRRSARQQQEAATSRAEDVTKSGGAPLPHLERIQRSFGRHDVSGIGAHTDPAAQQAARDLNAEAFATGDHVAFDGAPSLHTAAHEAAHVVQQRGGVRLKGGLDGGASDPYERHADAVADRVVRGDSSEELLDEMAPRGATRASSGGVQRNQGDKAAADSPSAGGPPTKDGGQPAAGTSAGAKPDAAKPGTPEAGANAKQPAPAGAGGSAEHSKDAAPQKNEPHEAGADAGPANKSKDTNDKTWAAIEAQTTLLQTAMGGRFDQEHLEEALRVCQESLKLFDSFDADGRAAHQGREAWLHNCVLMLQGVINLVPTIMAFIEKDDYKNAVDPVNLQLTYLDFVFPQADGWTITANLAASVKWIEEQANPPPDPLAGARKDLKGGEYLAKDAAAGKVKPVERKPAEGGAAASPELQEVQGKLRERAAEKRKSDPDRVPMTPAEEKLVGWALLSMSKHGEETDLKYGAIKYAGGEAREHTHAELRDGAFFWANANDGKDGKGSGKVEAPDWSKASDDSIRENAGMRVNIKLMEGAIKVLRDHGFADEAEKFSKQLAENMLTMDLEGAQNDVRDKAKADPGKLNQAAVDQVRAAGRLIFVMNEAGQFFAAESQLFAVHHSYFLAGGAVAAAGEIEIADGMVKAISSASGHYRPGPAYIWQAVKQLQMGKVNPSGLTVELIGAGILRGDEFLANFDPAAPEGSPKALSFDAVEAAKQVKEYLRRKSGGKPAESSAASTQVAAAAAANPGTPAT